MAFVIFMSDHRALLSRHIFTVESVIVGRAPDCDIVLHDSSASKRHCQVQWSDGALLMTDLDSSHGTFIDGNKVSRPTRVGGEQSVKIRGINLMLRPLSQRELSRHEEGEELDLETPTLLRTLNAEKDLMIRMGLLPKQERAPEPSSLDSIYRSMQPEDQAINKADSESPEPSSLNSIFHAVTPDDEKTGSSSLHSVYESVSSLSDEGSATDQRPPSSLNSIFNVVNPLSEEGGGESASSSSPVSEEEGVTGLGHGSAESQSFIAEVGSQEEVLSSSVDVEGSPSSLNSIYNVVNPVPDGLLNGSESEPSVENKPREPSSLHSIFNEVTPLNEELLGHSASGALDSAHQQVTEPPPGEPRAPRSLNSVFRAINPLAESKLKPISNAFRGQVDQLLSDGLVEAINLNGWQALKYRQGGDQTERSSLSPFVDLPQAQEAARSLLSALGVSGRGVGEGLLKEGSERFWVYVNLEIAHGPYICLERLSDLSQTSSLPQQPLSVLASALESGGRVVFIGDSVGEQVAVLYQALRVIFGEQRVVSVGLRADLDNQGVWLSLGGEDLALDQATSLSPSLLLIADRPSLSGPKLAEALSSVSPALLIYTASSLEAGVQDLSRKIGDEGLMRRAITHFASIKRTDDGEYQLSSISTYPEGRELFRL